MKKKAVKQNKPAHQTLMVQGTTSDAGKSTLVAGLCRVLWRMNKSVVPFKPQNMALNSAVTIDGGEIGRAQAVQAQACHLEPHTDMNPILLKPNSDTGAQVIIHGRAVTNMEAAVYHDYKRIAMAAVIESHERLERAYDYVIVEGAGSPAEINLRENDIANMGFAEAVDCPVIIIADIDKGGVFAHLVGTLALLSEPEQARVVGFVINRFRGDIGLLQSGLDWLEERTKKPVLGVLPYLHGFHLEAEDAVSIDQDVKGSLRVVVPVLPHISNHTDFDPLRLHPDVELIYVAPDQTPPPADLVILPGSKSVRNDLAWLKTQGWEAYLTKHLRYGGKLMGICGGYQMLGNMVHDPRGIESAPGSSAGFAFLDMETQLLDQKQLTQRKGQLVNRTIEVSGYEIHCGVTAGPALQQPLLALKSVNGSGDQPEGVVSEDGQVIGSYLHGLFDSSGFVDYLLRWTGLEAVQQSDYEARKYQDLDRLADTLEAYLDIPRLLAVMHEEGPAS